MSTTYTSAGLWGPNALLSISGAPVTNTPVTVYEHGSMTPATLYTDNTMVATVSNPVSTDSYGNLVFYTVPALYDLSFTVGGVPSLLTVMVAPWYVDSSIPTGTVFDFAGDPANVPAGWLLCDGSGQSSTNYPALFAVIGTQYGSGGGPDDFNLPPASGRVLVNVGTVTDVNGHTHNYTWGDEGGELDHSLDDDEMPGHAHGPPPAGATPGFVVGDTGSTVGLQTGGSNLASLATADLTTIVGNNGSAGNGYYHNTVQPFLAMPKIIKF